MKNHDMRLNDEYFDMINQNKKDIEYRLNDEKRKLIKKGDTITFYKKPLEEEKIKVLVTDLKYFKNLLEMYTASFDKELKERYINPQAVVDDTPFYTEDEIKKHGCLAIYFKKI